MSGSRGFDYLNSKELWDGKSEFGLEVPRKLLAALDNPQNKIPVIHVAGTNGKGSVCAMVASMLRAHGYSVGQFASPHLQDIAERCLVNGRPCEVEAFDKSLLRVKQAAERESLSPSYFEVVFAASCLEFVKQQLDWAVVEVGLGGRLDATNTVKRPVLSVITGVGYDHMHLLGETLAEIAAEKAGILRTEIPAFCGLMEKEPRAAIEASAEAVGTSVEFLDTEYMQSLEGFFVPLRGEHQRANAALAVRVARRLFLPENVIKNGLAAARWPGRLESVVLERDESGTAKLIGILDGAHNLDGVGVLSRYLRNFCFHEVEKPSKVIFLLSFLGRKQWKQMIDALRELEADLLDEAGVKIEFVFTDAGHRSCVSPKLLQKYAACGKAVNDPAEALEYAKSLAAKKSVIVTSGSIYLVGLLRPMMIDDAFCTMVFEEQEK